LVLGYFFFFRYSYQHSHFWLLISVSYRISYLRYTERSTTFLDSATDSLPPYRDLVLLTTLPYYPLRNLLSRWFIGTTASVILLASYIFDAIDLIQCVATRSLSGGCFQAYCLPVLDLSLSFSLRGCLRPYRFVWAVSLLTNSTSLLLLDSFSFNSSFVVDHSLVHFHMPSQKPCSTSYFLIRALL